MLATENRKTSKSYSYSAAMSHFFGEQPPSSILGLGKRYFGHYNCFPGAIRDIQKGPALPNKSPNHQALSGKMSRLALGLLLGDGNSSFQHGRKIRGETWPLTSVQGAAAPTAAAALLQHRTCWAPPVPELFLAFKLT